MKPPHEDMERALTELLDRTVEDFGPTALWNIPSGLPPRIRAKAVYAGVAKHGGRAGLRRATEIRQVLEALGETPWH
jgi:hypothetical protein